MTDTVTPAIRQAAGGDPHVTLAMEVGALLEGGLGPTYGVGDNGHSFGPFQINLPYHPGVSAAQAVDPGFAASYMLQAYQAAVSRVPEALWNTDPERAAEQAAFYAERPAQDYYVARGTAAVDEAYQHAVNSLGGSTGGKGQDSGTPAWQDPFGTIGDVIGNPGDVITNGLPAVAEVFGSFSPGNWFLDALKAIVTSGLVLRATLMATGLIILFIGLSQIDKGDQTASETVGSGASSVRVRVVQAKGQAKATAGKAAEGAAA